MEVRKSLNERVIHRMERAHSTLAEIEPNIANGNYHTAVSRMYYACYYAVAALLLVKGVSANSHAGMRQMLGLHYVRQGLFPRQLNDFYYDLHRFRNKGDYDEFYYFKREQVEKFYADAIELINTADAILKQLSIKE